MRSGTALIHECGCDGAVVGAFIYFFLYFLIGINTVLLKTLYIDSKGFVLAYFELVFLGFCEEVSNMFVVDFHHAHLDLKGTRTILITVNLFEDLIADYGYDSLIGSVADHGIAFA